MASLIEPSRLFFQFDGTRRLIIASYWLVILLATPLWWHLTSIERLSLPAARVNAQAHTLLKFPTTVQLDPSVSPSTASELQTLLNGLVEPNLSVKVQPGTSETTPELYHVSTANTVNTLISGRHLTFYNDTPSSSMADIIAKLLDPFPVIKDYRVVPYASRYRLSFTLLNEDSASGSYMKGWDIHSALRRHIKPICSRVSILHNCTIESQVQFHGPLSFEPFSLEDGSFGLTPEELTVFVNSAEWTLSSSSSNDPVLHFVLFVPSASRRPLKIMETTVNTFLIPQWGGVVIYNPPSSQQDYMSASALDGIFSSFSQHLLTLLGFSDLPSNVLSDDGMSDWQLDALLRRRALENDHGAKEILRSTIKLVEDLESMPVGEVVRDDVEAALSALERLHSLSLISLKDAAQLTSEAFSLASRAFFNPGMLALLYFPAEHKYAVYTPLFASAVIPLAAAAAREFMAWKKERKAMAP